MNCLDTPQICVLTLAWLCNASKTKAHPCTPKSLIRFFRRFLCTKLYLALRRQIWFPVWKLSESKWSHLCHTPTKWSQGKPWSIGLQAPTPNERNYHKRLSDHSFAQKPPQPRTEILICGGPPNNCLDKYHPGYWSASQGQLLQNNLCSPLPLTFKHFFLSSFAFLNTLIVHHGTYSHHKALPF
jgi:hypothetical protein